MALERTTISLNLGDTLDQKDNDKTGQAGTFNDLKDWVWNKLKRLDKRPGTKKLPTTVQSSFPNPLTIAASPIASGLFSHRNQLVLQNKGALYSYLQDQQAWAFKGHHFPLEASASVVQSNEAFILTQDVGLLANTRVYAYLVFNGGAVVNLNITVTDELTGNKKVSDLTISSSDRIYYVNVVSFASAIFVMWQDGTFIRSCPIDPVTGAPGTIVTLKSDAQFPGLDFSEGSGKLALNKALTVAYANLPVIGERVFFTYYSTGLSANVASMKSDGTLDTVMGTTSYGALTSLLDSGFGLYYSTQLNRLILAYTSTGTLSYQMQLVTFTIAANAIAQVGTSTQPYDGLTNGAGMSHAITLCDDPINAGQTLVFFDGIISSFINSNIYKFPTIFRMSFNGTVLSAATVVAKGLLLSGKAIPDVTDRKTVYLIATYGSDLEGTTFLLDVFRGKSEAAAYVQAKLSPGEAFSYFLNPNLRLFGLANGCPNWVSSSPGTVSFTSLTKAFASFAAATATTSVNSNVYTTALTKNDINLRPKLPASNAFLNNGTHLSGGYVGYYDGTSYQEHGFFVPPDQVEAFALNGTKAIGYVINPGVDGSSPLTYDNYSLTFFGGAAIATCAGPASYFTFNSSGNYCVYFIVNGVGTAPVLSGTYSYIAVRITGLETAGQLATKVRQAFLLSSAVNNSTIIALNQTLSITNTNPGSHSGGSSIVGFDTAIGMTPLPVGAYQYCIVWNWVDHNGQMFRSAPSVPVTANVTTASVVNVSFLAPPITNRANCADVGVEVYRTALNQTTFHRISIFPLSLRFNSSSVVLSILDSIPDSLPGGVPGATVQSGEQLYTTGGIQANYSLPAVKNISKFKNRILASGFDETSVAYTKTAVPNDPVNFTAANSVSLDDDGQTITGHKQLDDKLIIFKEKSIIAYAGDGANDTGLGSSFSQPQIIASDVGCTAQNTIELVPDGIFFRSKMGIQKLDRNLQVSYPGIAVKDFNGFTLSKAQVLRDDTTVREIRFLLADSPYAIVYDYLVGKWTVFSNYAAQDACLWKDSFARVDSLGLVSVEDKTLFVDQGSATPSYAPLLETQWLKIKGVQDFQRISRMMILGDLKSPHVLNFQLYYDYDESNYDSYAFASSAIAGSAHGDSVYQPELHLRRQKCQAIKIVMTVTPVGGSEETLTLTDMSFELGVKRGLNKVKSGKKL